MAGLTQLGGNAVYNAANPTPPNTVPATVVSGTPYSTGLMACMGYHGLAAAANLSVAGTLVIQRYMDAAGSFPIGDPAISTQALTGGTLGTVAVNDGLPCAFWQVTITAGSGTGNLTAFNLLQTMP